MEFHIALSGPAPDLERFRAAVSRLDPAASVDRDQLVQQIRVSAALSSSELQDAARQADWDLDEAQIVRQASVCCGGCGG
ncbi:MAG: hypothetical protein DCF27_01215 [Lysobacteraceae bacterium]|nr:MAG: hypothetical protein DCF27_01215 [Xanthomonadaceae bacterium]